jgi:hypothetical protein
MGIFFLLFIGLNTFKFSFFFNFLIEKFVHNNENEFFLYDTFRHLD